MLQGRRVNRIHSPSIEVRLRLQAFLLSEIALWREDHFTQTTRSPIGETVVQRYLVLDFGAEERAITVTDTIPDPNLGTRPVPRLDDNGRAVIEWMPTGAIHVELQRVDDDGAGLSTPTVKIIPAPKQDTIETGWVGWEHVADSPRRPSPGKFLPLEGGTMDVAGNLHVVEELARELIVQYGETGQHIGLSVNYAERRCYVCDEVWPCAKATDWGETVDVDSETESVSGESATSG